MKLLVLCCLVAVAAAAPAPADSSAGAQILKYEYDNFGPNGFRYAYDQSDGTQAEAQGELIKEGKEDAALIIKGFFQYIGPNGALYRVTYIADQGGYQPTIIEEEEGEGPGGTPPPFLSAKIPKLILNSILGPG